MVQKIPSEKSHILDINKFHFGEKWGWKVHSPPQQKCQTPLAAHLGLPAWRLSLVPLRSRHTVVPRHLKPVCKRALGTQTQRHTDLLPIIHGSVRSCALKWVRQLTFLFSRGSSQPRNQTRISCIAGRFFTKWANKEAQLNFKEDQ